ncbi:MAG: P1 family peptidase [Gemmatimonadota bacterium]
MKRGGRRNAQAALYLCAQALAATGTAAAQDRSGLWRGTARYPDGATESWTLHVWSNAGVAHGDLLFDAGSGMVLHDVDRSDGFAFAFQGSGMSGPVQCSLRGTRTLAGSCTDPSGGSVSLSLETVADGAAPDYRDDGSVRPRAREIGLVVGVLPTGTHNAITDVPGVRVGHATVMEGDSIRTGVTAVVPAAGDLYARPVPAWIHSANGYGKLIGETQVREFGEIETPVLLTCTLCVWSAARGLAWTLMDADPGPDHTINPVVGETNDSWLNDMWVDPIGPEHVREALANARSGPVAEGSVGAGTGTTAFGWKGGIGTSSRLLPASLGGWSVGVLVQTNFGGTLSMNGAPVGRALGSFSYEAALSVPDAPPQPSAQDGGSLMIVVATDAPLTAAALARLSERAMLGAGRTGSFMHNSSGDYVIAFSSAESVRRPRDDPEPRALPSLSNAQMSPLFAAVVEATEEAIYNALLKATTVRGRGRVYKALPLASTRRILEEYGALDQNRSLPPRR